MSHEWEESEGGYWNCFKTFYFRKCFFFKLLTLGSLKLDLLQWASVFPSYWQVVTMPARRLHTCSCGRSCLCDWRTPWGKSICCLIIYWTGLRSGWCRVGKFKKKKVDWKVVVKLMLYMLSCLQQRIFEFFWISQFSALNCL